MKKYAVKFYSQASENQNPQKMPAYWPWVQNEISEAQVEEFTGHGWTIFTAEEYQNYINSKQSDFDAWYNNRVSETNSSRLKIYDLVDDEFSKFHPAKIDFTIHLKPNIVLNKKTIMLKNGRPSKSEYYHDGQKIAEIKFEFVANAQNFLTKRTELLGYVRGDGEISEFYKIHEKIYDMNNINDKAMVTDERQSARKYIMEEIKSILNDVLGLYYIVLPPAEDKKTITELYQLAGAFWNSYSAQIDSWFNTATGDFKDQILAETNHAFLDLMVPPQISGLESPISVRNYIVDRITY
jgi:hypothetical protein